MTFTGQNLRLNAETAGIAATDGPSNGVNNAAVSAVAYLGNTAGVTNIVLYDLDATTGKLYTQKSDGIRYTENWPGKPKATFKKRLSLFYFLL